MGAGAVGGTVRTALGSASGLAGGRSVGGDAVVGEGASVGSGVGEGVVGVGKGVGVDVCVGMRVQVDEAWWAGVEDCVANPSGSGAKTGCASTQSATTAVRAVTPSPRMNHAMRLGCTVSSLPGGYTRGSHPASHESMARILPHCYTAGKHVIAPHGWRGGRRTTIEARVLRRRGCPSRDGDLRLSSPPALRGRVKGDVQTDGLGPGGRAVDKTQC